VVKSTTDAGIPRALNAPASVLSPELSQLVVAQGSTKLENSSALPFEKGPSSGPNPPVGETNVTGSPLFRRFDTNLEPWLRDGQSIQTIASTDPVTGEVVKIDVTVNVIP